MAEKIISKLNTKSIFFFKNFYLNRNIRKVYYNDIRITKSMRDRNFFFYDGKKFLEKKITKQMLGFRVGELIKTRATFIHENKQNRKKQNKRNKNIARRKSKKSIKGG